MEGHSAFNVNDTLAEVPGFKTNIRETDQQLIGIVTDRYSIVQNQEAFAFTDEFLGKASSMKQQADFRMAIKFICSPSFPKNTHQPTSTNTKKSALTAKLKNQPSSTYKQMQAVWRQLAGGLDGFDEWVN